MSNTSEGTSRPEQILDLMVKSLPTRTSEESKPAVKDAFAAIALLTHASMLAVGFRLVGLDEDHKLGLFP